MANGNAHPLNGGPQTVPSTSFVLAAQVRNLSSGRCEAVADRLCYKGQRAIWPRELASREDAGVGEATLG